jgi:hypothetical protein
MRRSTPLANGADRWIAPNGAREYVLLDGGDHAALETGRRQRDHRRYMISSLVI